MQAKDHPMNRRGIARRSRNSGSREGREGSEGTVRVGLPSLSARPSRDTFRRKSSPNATKLGDSKAKDAEKTALGRLVIVH
jgi:hypothetical protein